MMTVAQLIEKLRGLPDQNAPVIFTYASETDGSLCVAEIEKLKPRPMHRDRVVIMWDPSPNYQANVSTIELL